MKKGCWKALILEIKGGIKISFTGKTIVERSNQSSDCWLINEHHICHFCFWSMFSWINVTVKDNLQLSKLRCHRLFEQKKYLPQHQVFIETIPQCCKILITNKALEKVLSITSTTPICYHDISSFSVELQDHAKMEDEVLISNFS